jgi:hypothetical protein
MHGETPVARGCVVDLSVHRLRMTTRGLDVPTWTIRVTGIGP